MGRVRSGCLRRSVAQEASSNSSSLTYGHATWSRVLLCAMVMGIGASVGWSEPVPDTTRRADLLPTWSGLCSLSVGGAVVRWAVGDSGRVLKTMNGDTTAGYVLGRGQYDLCGVSFADANHGWIVGNKRDEPGRGRGVVFSTKRGGDKASEWLWSCPVIRPDVHVPFVKVQALSVRHVWLTCGDGYMLYSNDGGARWAVTTKHPRHGESRTIGSDHEK
jgi:photosystem II stability/assembly factor-like uncharacterized protein